MSLWYLDTSAALKLLVEEAESVPLAEHLDARSPELVSCLLIEAELRRAAQRHPPLSQEAVTQLLDRISLSEVPGSLFREAGLLTGVDLRSLDALHLMAAIRQGVDAVLTYDHRMARAARDLGVPVVAPA